MRAPDSWKFSINFLTSSPYYTILYHTILYYTTLYFIIPYYIILRPGTCYVKGRLPGPLGLPVAVFGVGSSAWPAFNAAARRPSALGRGLGAQELDTHSLFPSLYLCIYIYIYVCMTLYIDIHRQIWI